MWHACKRICFLGIPCHNSDIIKLVKGKALWRQSLHGKQQPRFHWSCSSFDQRRNLKNYKTSTRPAAPNTRSTAFCRDVLFIFINKALPYNMIMVQIFYLTTYLYCSKNKTVADNLFWYAFSYKMSTVTRACIKQKYIDFDNCISIFLNASKTKKIKFSTLLYQLIYL